MADSSESEIGQASPVENQIDQASLYNVTKDNSDAYSKFCLAYISPIVLIITLITSTLVVLVLSQRHMRTPTNIVLFTMAIVDLFTLLSPSPWYFYVFTLGYDNLLYPPTACYTHYIMTDVIPVFFHTSSIWLALLLASQRYIYVCHPTLASTWCTVPRVKRAIIIIIIVAFAHQITKFFDYRFVPVRLEIDGREQNACRAGMADWVKHLMHEDPYHFTYYFFRIAFVFIIPIFSLILLNFLLFRALRKADDKRTRLLKTKFKSIGPRSSVGNVESIKHSSFTQSNNYNNNGCLLTTNMTSSQGVSCDFTKSIGRKSTGSALDRINSIVGSSHNEDSGGGSGGGSSISNSKNQRANRGNCDRPAERKSRAMFSIGPFQLRRKSQGISGDEMEGAAGRQRPRPPGSAGLPQSVNPSPNDEDDDDNELTTSDTKLASSRGAERVGGNEERAYRSANAGFSLRGRLSRARQFMRGGQGGEANVSCSIASIRRTIRERDFRNGNNCDSQGPASAPPTATLRPSKALAREPGPGKLLGAESVDGGGGGGAEDELASCADCAACQRNFESECRHCSASAASEGATVGAGRHSLNSPARHQNFNRTVSQCSSLLGGAATNTTTNEEGSICMTIQNACSSMLGAHYDGTLDAAEVTSMREEEAETYEEFESGCGGGDRVAQADETTTTTTAASKRNQSVPKRPIGARMSSPLAQSDSEDSRLACGCMSPSPTGRASSSLATSQLRSSSTRHDCRECCMASGCRRANAGGGATAEAEAAAATLARPATKLASAETSRLGSERNAQGASSSEPLISCTSFRTKSGARANIGVHQDGDDSDGGGAGSRRLGASSGGCISISNDDDDDDGRHHQHQFRGPGRMPTSQSDYGDREGAREEPKSPVGANAVAITNASANTNTNTTTTTTTTLYSNNAASINSLIQVQPQPASGGCSSVAAAATSLASKAVSGTKRRASQVSPFFANFSAARGSRATLTSGSTTNPSGQQQQQLALQLGGTGNFVAATHASTSVRTMDSNRTTLMLIVVVTVFLIIEVPNAVATIIHVLDSLYDGWITGYNFSWIYNVRLFTNFFMTISSPINFTIYCSMSKKFRETFRELFLGRRAKQKRSHRLIYQHPQVSQCAQTQINFNQDTQTSAAAAQTPKADQSNTDNIDDSTLDEAAANLAKVRRHASEHFTATAGGANHSDAGVATTSSELKYPPPRRHNGQQQECEL